MTVQIVVRADLAPHVSVALAAHMRRCREQGVTVPAGLVDVRDWCVVVARGLSGEAPLPVGDPAPVGILLSLPEVGEQLGCSLSKVKKLISDGVLPAVHFGGARRVRRVDLEGYVDSLAGPFRERLSTKASA